MLLLHYCTILYEGELLTIGRNEQTPGFYIEELGIELRLNQYEQWYEKGEGRTKRAGEMGREIEKALD